jgi:hypothetical protein
VSLERKDINFIKEGYIFEKASLKVEPLGSNYVFQGNVLMNNLIGLFYPTLLRNVRPYTWD